MTFVAVFAVGMNYGTALVVAAIVIGVATRLGMFYGQGIRIFRRR